ncbi:lipase family protein [Crenothrix polyspora]|uniref:lipase family protein n=1 Tax=Crenothrix polyspora TaxID=360316 RepID=UPI000B34B79C|nr:lipase family protein [Crenothrix polyspora]
MDSALRSRLSKIISLSYEQDWSDESFSLKKAHVCAELSSIVYEDVQKYELKKASRIHLFASDTYRRLINSGKANSILSSLDESNLDAQFFVVRGRYALILGTCFNNVVILTVRGTVFRRLWDWKANVDAERFYLQGNANLYPFEFGFMKFDDQFFHRGFFESIVPQLPSITDEIQKRMNSTSDLKIVWAGHSLGGAMAAIGNALCRSDIARRFFVERMPGSVVGAYTFGMPRYCGLGAISCFAGPYHVYKAMDIVPTVPLRNMGFVDCCREYEITDTGTVALSERTDTFGMAGHIPKLLSSIEAHSIEGYAGSIANALGVSRP